MTIARHPLHRIPGIAAVLVALLAGAGCTVGPNFVEPHPTAPADWSSWHGGSANLAVNVDTGTPLQPDWWRAFHDPVLDRLEQRAFAASPDLQTAALHFAQARVQRSTVAAQRGPDVSVGGGATRQRSSEYGASTRIVNALAADRSELTKVLSQPYTLYQAGFDATWELDLWGRVRRSIEAADADVAQQKALLDAARLSIASDVARNYFQLRTTQRQIRLTKDEIATLEQRLKLIEARMQAGALDHLDLDQQRTEWLALKSQLPGLMAQAGASQNQLTLLLGERPGALRDKLRPQGERNPALPPDLALGLPSEVARRRPDIRAAEARLRSATANIGVAKADLYPHVTLGAHFGYESYSSGEFGDWGSRAWSVGPSLDLPLFDHGRRKSVVVLRELQQQEAAVAYQRTVLRSWQEIDDALSGYASARAKTRQLADRVRSAKDAYDLTQARYDAGAVDFVTLLDSQRALLQARRDRVASQGQLDIEFVAVNKAVGNVPDSSSELADSKPVNPPRG